MARHISDLTAALESEVAQISSQAKAGDPTRHHNRRAYDLLDDLIDAAHYGSSTLRHAVAALAAAVENVIRLSHARADLNAAKGDLAKALQLVASLFAAENIDG